MSKRITPSDEEFKNTLSDLSNPLIRSMQDWEEFCLNKGHFSKTPASSILRHPNLVSEITKNIKFSEQGLAHLNYGNAKDILTYNEFMGFLEIFGINIRVLTDRDNYRCDGNHTCVMNTNTICTSSC